MRVIDNQEEYLKDIQSLTSDRSHSLEFANNTEYAAALHDHEGYSVFADSRLLNVTEKWLRDLVNSDQPLDVRHVQMALDAAGFEGINWHRSYTGKLRPPVRAGEGGRQAHPSPLNWADRTGLLKAGYTHRPDSQPFRSEGQYK